MKLLKTTLLASLLVPAGVGCLEDNSGEDATTTGSTSGTMTSDSTASTTTDSTASGTTGTTTGGTTDGVGGSTATGTTDTTSTTSAGGTASTSTDTASTGAGGTSAVNDLDPDTLIPGLDGLFWAFRTMNPDDPGDFKYWLTGTDEECPTGDWATGGVSVTKEFQAMGTAGQQYTINFELRGALSLRCYSDGTPTGMAPDAMGINEAFYVGGQQFGDSPVNTVELAVIDATTSSYFLNGIPSTSDMCDTGITYDVQYQAQFVIMGDSQITLSTHASDCQALQNCGADPGGAGCDPRIVDVEGVQVKASPAQPISDYLGGIEFFPQWLVFDIQSITSP